MKVGRFEITLNQLIWTFFLETKSKTRFDTVQTMVEAKFALRGLFEQAAQYHRNYMQTQKALTDVQETNKEVNNSLVILYNFFCWFVFLWLSITTLPSQNTKLFVYFDFS